MANMAVGTHATGRCPWGECQCVGRRPSPCHRSPIVISSYSLQSPAGLARGHFCPTSLRHCAPALPACCPLPKQVNTWYTYVARRHCRRRAFRRSAPSHRVELSSRVGEPRRSSDDLVLVERVIDRLALAFPARREGRELLLDILRPLADNGGGRALPHLGLVRRRA